MEGICSLLKNLKENETIQRFKKGHLEFPCLLKMFANVVDRLNPYESSWLTMI